MDGSIFYRLLFHQILHKLKLTSHNKHISIDFILTKKKFQCRLLGFQTQRIKTITMCFIQFLFLFVGINKSFLKVSTHTVHYHFAHFKTTSKQWNFKCELNVHQNLVRHKYWRLMRVQWTLMFRTLNSPACFQNIVTVLYCILSHISYETRSISFDFRLIIFVACITVLNINERIYLYISLIWL